MRILATLPILLAGCQIDEPGGEGIAVGNPPGTAQVRVTVANGVDVFMNELALPIGGIYAETCDGEGLVVDADRDTVLGLGSGSVEIDAGTYCVLGLIPNDRLVELDGEAGVGTFHFASALSRILVYGEITLEDGDERVLELAEPGWLTATDFALTDGQHLDIGGDACLDDSLCAAIRSGLMDRSGLYHDGNGDGNVDDTERDEGADASGSDRRDTDQAR